jgi:hypothetical protein
MIVNADLVMFMCFVFINFEPTCGGVHIWELFMCFVFINFEPTCGGVHIWELFMCFDMWWRAHMGVVHVLRFH